MKRNNQKTKVVNRKNEYEDSYIGRGSKFGNPYIIGKDGNREEVIKKFSVYFYKKLESQRFQAAVRKLKGCRLGCFCRPPEGFRGRLMCHGQIIAGWLEGVKPEEIE